MRHNDSEENPMPTLQPRTLGKYRMSPFGMNECCICDAPTTHASPTDRDELLPYCEDCMRALKAEFPNVEVMIWA